MLLVGLVSVALRDSVESADSDHLLTVLLRFWLELNRQSSVHRAITPFLFEREPFVLETVSDINKSIIGSVCCRCGHGCGLK